MSDETLVGKYASADELLDNLTYGGLDLERPVLASTCRSIVSDLKVEMETRSKVPQLVAKLTTEEVCKDMKGSDVQAGYVSFWRSNLQPHPNVAPDKRAEADRINKEEQARFMCACLGVKYDKASPPSLKPLEQYVGRSLVVTYKAREEKDRETGKGNGRYQQDVKGFHAVA